MKKYLFIILFLIPAYLYPQQWGTVDSLLNSMYTAGNEERDSIGNKIIGILYNSELKDGKVIDDSLLQVLSKTPFKKFYVLALVHSWRFYNFDGKIALLDKAYPVANSLKDYSLIGLVEVYKALAYRDNSMTDSAMTYALRARDRLEKTGNPEDLDDVNNLIGDLYYWAGQYEEAEKLYRQLLGKKSVQNTWRQLTLQDDIGSIKIRQKKFPEAEKYFKKSLRFLTSKKMFYADSAALPYLYRLLLEAAVLQKHFTDAEKYYKLAEFAVRRFGQKEYFAPVYTFKGDMLFYQHKYDSAIVYYKKALNFHSAYPNIEDAVNIYEGLSKTYAAKKDTRNAYHYLGLLNEAQSKADSIFYKARSLTTLAEYNYNNYRREIGNYKQRQTFLIIFISIISVSLFTIIYFFIRLGRANRKLVTKNIELAMSTEPITLQPGNKSEETELPQTEQDIPAEEEFKKGSKKLDEDFIKNIIYGLEKLMADEKVYLQPELSLDQLSELLETNRTYLSQAINSAYNVNFASYINDLRIKEAVRIISGGEHKNFSIEGVAQKAGFNNRVSFTKAFYKYTGVSPSFFIRNLESR